jgi:peptide/nickel transport system permease protein
MSIDTTTVSVGQLTPGSPARGAETTESTLRRLLRKPLAIASLAWIVVIVAACAAAPLIAPNGPLAEDLNAVSSGPSGAHPLGTDSLGRDVLARLLYGGRPTLLGVVEAVAVAGIVGVAAGVTAGYFGGWFDKGVGQVVDLVMAIPAIVVLLAVLAVFPGNMLAAMVTLGFLGAAGITRVIRGATLSVREELYIEAARISGVSHPRIVVRHVAKRVTGPIIVQLSLFAALAVVFQTGLSFLGLGIQPPAPSWGGLMSEASQVLTSDPWLLVPPGVAVGLTVLALGLLGDAARDATAERWSSRLWRSTRRGQPLATASGLDPDPAAALSVRGLTIAVESGDTQTTLVDGVSFDLHAGEALGIVGESGCGKTMTSMAVMGLLPEGVRVAAGEMWLNGERLPLNDDSAMNKIRGAEIGMIFQEPAVSLDPAFRIDSQLAEVIRRHQKCSRREARNRALELLRTVKIRDPEQVAKRYPHQISGGMAQRVCIARALATNPRVLIADEPTTALDVTVQADILDMLTGLREGSGMAIVLVTHDWGVIADACTRALVLYAGQVVEVGQVDALCARPKHPYTADLLRANPHFAEPGKPLPTIPGSVAKGHSGTGCGFAPRCRLATDDCRTTVIDLRADESGQEYRCLHSEALTAGLRAEPLSLPGMSSGQHRQEQLVVSRNSDSGERND